MEEKSGKKLIWQVGHLREKNQNSNLIIFFLVCVRARRTLEGSEWAMVPLKTRLKSSSMTSSHSTLRRSLR